MLPTMNRTTPNCQDLYDLCHRLLLKAWNKYTRVIGSVLGEVQHLIGGFIFSSHAARLL